MGLIISRFRKKPSTKESLEKLEKSIKSLEQYHFSTQQKQKHIIGALLLYSIILYIVVVAVFYFLYFPDERNQQIIYAIPLLIFPVLVFLAKKFLHWYFARKITRNDIKIIDLRKEKKKILEKVMETETYKVAKELLDKFEEKPNKPDNTEKLKKTAEDMELRKRTASARGIAPNQVRVPLANGSGVLSAVPTPRGYVSNMKSPVLTRPILPKDRGVADRLVEYLIGDGPNARFALICRRCNSHNGMALQEEFEFLAFRCCYCQYPNPARKMRPNAPKLPESPQLTPLPVRRPSPETTNSDEAKSEGETEEEVMSEPEEQKEQTQNPLNDEADSATAIEENEEQKDKAKESPTDTPQNLEN